MELPVESCFFFMEQDLQFNALSINIQNVGLFRAEKILQGKSVTILQAGSHFTRLGQVGMSIVDSM